MNASDPLRPSSPRAWASLLRRNWNLRGSSPHRDFYVASHPGWEDPKQWKAQAEVDVELILHGLDPEWLRGAEVLEIGCGVGRLVPSLLERVQTYSGFDVSTVMTEEARRRCRDYLSARFFESDGLSVPEPARDRTYDLVLALAVFIHCPREVISSLVRSAFPLLKPGGQLRFQLLADPDDTEGLDSPEAAESVHEDSRRIEAGVTEEQKALIDGYYYMGETFRFREVEPMLRDWTGGRVRAFRLDLGHVYGWIERVPGPGYS